MEKYAFDSWLYHHLRFHVKKKKMPKWLGIRRREGVLGSCLLDLSMMGCQKVKIKPLFCSFLSTRKKMMLIERMVDGVGKKSCKNYKTGKMAKTR